MRVLDRYILGMLWPLFAMGVLLFAGIIFFFAPLREALELARETGISQGTMWKLLALRCPGLIVYVLPMGMLFSCALLTGRMAEGGEVVAASMAGVTLPSLLRCAFVFAALAGLFGGLFNERVAVPAANRAEALEQSLKTSNQGKVQRHIRFVDVDAKTGRAQLLVYADSFDPDRGVLTDVTLVWFADADPPAPAPPACPRLVRAAEAKHEGGGFWRVNDVTVWVTPTGEPTSMPSYTIDLKRDPSEVRDVRHPERLLNSEGLRARIAEMAPEARVNPNVARVRDSFLMELWLRWTIPLTCLPFALLGAPLGARPQGGGLSLSLGLSVLVSFVYYTVLRYADAAGRDGQLAPPIAASLTLVLALAAGVVLLRRSQH
jgi:lipopolysaccharide export system permease protein